MEKHSWQAMARKTRSAAALVLFVAAFVVASQIEKNRRTWGIIKRPHGDRSNQPIRVLLPAVCACLPMTIISSLMFVTAVLAIALMLYVGHASETSCRTQLEVGLKRHR